MSPTDMDKRGSLRDGRIKNWFWCPNAIFKMGLSKHGLVVYLYLCRVAGDKHSCWPSLKTISMATKCSRGVVVKAIEELKKAGLVEPEERFNKDGDRDSNNYTLFNPEVGGAAGDHPTHQAHEGGAAGDHGGSPGGQEEELPEEKLVKKKNLQHTGARAAQIGRPSTRSFDRFWNVIPKRISRGKAKVEAWEVWKTFDYPPTKQQVDQMVKLVKDYLYEDPSAYSFYEHDGTVKVTPARLIGVLCRAIKENRPLADVLEDVMLEDLEAGVPA
jgi:GntR family transcriptional regulator